MKLACQTPVSQVLVVSDAGVQGETAIGSGVARSPTFCDKGCWMAGW